MNYAIVLFIVLVLLIVIKLYDRQNLEVVSAHVINLESSKDRLDEFNKTAERACGGGLKITRWPAVNGKAMSEEEAVRAGIRKEIYEKYKAKKRLGAIGCFLSHKTLLAELAKMDVGPNAAHLIFEDDAQLEPNFVRNLNKTLRSAPQGWEFLQIGMHWPELKPLYDNFHIPIGKNKNMGTFAYLVRHSALPMINAYISDMKMPIDNQYLEMKHVWRYYVVYPELVKSDYDMESTINE